MSKITDDHIRIAKAILRDAKIIKRRLKIVLKEVKKLNEMLVKFSEVLSETVNHPIWSGKNKPTPLESASK